MRIMIRLAGMALMMCPLRLEKSDLRGYLMLYRNLAILRPYGYAGGYFMVFQASIQLGKICD